MHIVNCCPKGATKPFFAIFDFLYAFWGTKKKTAFFDPKNRDCKSTLMDLDENWYEQSLTCQNWGLNIFFLFF